MEVIAKNMNLKSFHLRFRYSRTVLFVFVIQVTPEIFFLPCYIIAAGDRSVVQGGPVGQLRVHCSLPLLSA